VKKMIFVMAVFVFMFAAPVIAGTVTITVVDMDDLSGRAEIRYAADANVRAFALDVTVDAGTITDITNYFVGECNAVNKGYGVFPGTVEILDTGEVNDWGSPVAEVADLPSDTKPGLGNNGVTIEMGALYTPGNRPSRTGTLCRLRVSTTCHMTVTGNVGRGKVVLEDGTQATLNLAGATNVPIFLNCCPGVPNIVGMAQIAAEAAIIAVGLTVGNETAEWNNAALDCQVLAQNPVGGTLVPSGTPVNLHVARNYPACWDWPGQYNGDCLGNDLQITLADFQVFKAAFSGAYDPAADFDRDGNIGLDDFQIFKVGFTAGVVVGGPTGPFGPAGPCP
jgi:hypothetical protein